MSRHACPICGDPSAYPIWVDKDPPTGCPEDMRSWGEGGPPQVRNVTECAYQMRKAAQRAEWRRVLPDAFDRDGNMLPGRLPDVLLAYGASHPGKAIIL